MQVTGIQPAVREYQTTPDSDVVTVKFGKNCPFLECLSTDSKAVELTKMANNLFARACLPTVYKEEEFVTRTIANISENSERRPWDFFPKLLVAAGGSAFDRMIEEIVEAGPAISANPMSGPAKIQHIKCILTGLKSYEGDVQTLDPKIFPSLQNRYFAKQRQHQQHQQH